MPASVIHKTDAGLEKIIDLNMQTVDAVGGADVNERTEVIAAILPNEEGVGQHRWIEYVTSIDDIERQTGYELLSNVPDGARKTVETRVAEGL